MVVEEAPDAPYASASRSAQILALSARNASALDTSKRNLAAHLREHPDLDISDACHTLLLGRERFEHRWVATCNSREDAIRALDLNVAARTRHLQSRAQERNVIYLFPGGGAQYLKMGAGLYAAEPIFKSHVDACAAAAATQLGRD